MTPEAVNIQFTQGMSYYPTWLMLIGAIMVVVGVIAITHARRASVFATKFFGWLLVIAAALSAGSIFLAGNWPGIPGLLFSAVIFGVIGILLLTRPFLSMEAITLLMAAYFLITGIFQVLAPFILPFASRGWAMLNGGVNVILGILIFSQFPAAAAFVIGLFLGIDLLFDGIFLIALGLGSG